eukprot:scaffold47_cov334-Pavlova_lutheri.AAC.3
MRPPGRPPRESIPGIRTPLSSPVRFPASGGRAVEPIGPTRTNRVSSHPQRETIRVRVGTSIRTDGVASMQHAGNKKGAWNAWDRTITSNRWT